MAIPGGNDSRGVEPGCRPQGPGDKEEDTMFTRADPQQAGIELLRCAKYNRGVIYRETFVQCDVWYDAQFQAVCLGLRKHMLTTMNIIYAFLGFLFYHACQLLCSCCHGTLEADGYDYYFR